MSKFLFALFCLTAFLPSTHVLGKDIRVEKIMRFTIDSTINPATYNYLKSGFSKAQKDGYQMILITIATPGGLVSTTKDILTLFGESPIPIIVWVSPEGASATSAGATIDN